MPNPRYGDSSCYLEVQGLRKTFIGRKRKVETSRTSRFVWLGEMIGFSAQTDRQDYHHQIGSGSGKTIQAQSR